MADFAALETALGAGFMQSNEVIFDGMADDHAFQPFADGHAYIEFLNEVHTGRLMGCALRENRNLFVIGAGVSSNLTDAPQGDPVVIAGLDAVNDPGLKSLSGNDWRCAPTWRQLLARISLVLAIGDPEFAGVLPQIGENLQSWSLDEASNLIHQRLPDDLGRGAIRTIMSLCTVTNPGVAAALHAYKSTMVSMNYDYLFSQALDNARVPQSLHSLADMAMLDEDQQPEWINIGAADTGSVYHLHGMLNDVAYENGFTLFPAEYDVLPTTVALVRLVAGVLGNPNGSASHTMIFVGAEGTISDPHFTALWYVLGKRKSGGGDVPWWIPHYILVKGDLPHGLDAASEEARAMVNRPPPATHRIVATCVQIFNTYRIRLIPIVYGFEYSDLAEFLNSNKPHYCTAVSTDVVIPAIPSVDEDDDGGRRNLVCVGDPLIEEVDDLTQAAPRVNKFCCCSVC